MREGGLLSRLRPHATKLVASLVIAGGFVWMFRRGGLPFLPSDEVLSHVQWWCVPAYTVLFVTTMTLRTFRWVYLLRAIAPAHSWRTLGIGFIGYGVIVFAPLRAGELARPLMVSRDGNVTFSQATGTVAAERIIDGFLVSIVLLIGILTAQTLNPLPDHLGTLPVPVAAVPRTAYAALALFTCAFAAMGLFYRARAFARRITHAVVGVVSQRLATWVTNKIEHVADGLSFLPSPSHGVPFFRDTLLYWVGNVLLAYLGMRGCGVPVTLTQAMVIQGVMALGILVPSGPGFFGAYQLSGFCALAMFFQEPVVLGPGAAFLFVSFTVQLGGTFLSMLVGALLMRQFPAIEAPSPAAITDQPSTPATE